MSPEVVSILAVLATIVLTILAYVMVIPEKKRASLKPFFKFLHDVAHFKFLIVEKILRFFYIFLTILTVCFGFFMLFVFVESWGGVRWYGLEGILIMILGPIVIRLIFELSMMFILLIKNVIQINNKLKNQNEGDHKDVFAAPEIQFPVAPKANFCEKCGAKLNEDGSCPNCK